MGTYKDFEWKSPFKSEAFVALGVCKRCGLPTFAKSGICDSCTIKLENSVPVEEELAPAFPVVDCE